jgi:thiamine biosynthesis lipoprotein
MPLFRFDFDAMASPNELQIWHDDESRARTLADTAIADVRRIEAKYSRYRDDSVTSRINRAAGGAVVAIDAETYALLGYADHCHRLSAGRFAARGIFAVHRRDCPTRTKSRRRSR